MLVLARSGWFAIAAGSAAATGQGVGHGGQQDNDQGQVEIARRYNPEGVACGGCEALSHGAGRQ